MTEEGVRNAKRKQGKTKERVNNFDPIYKPKGEGGG